MESRRLKGINFFGTLAAFERELGAAARQKLEAELTEPLKSAMEHGEIVAAGWYPAEWYDALLRAILTQPGVDLPRLKRIAREAVIHDFKTLFRVMRMFIAPSTAASQALRVASRYIDGGKIAVVEADDGRVHFQFTEFWGYTHLMWLDFIGGIEGVLESMGCRDIASRVQSGGGDRDDTLSLVITWTI
ncbi:MAG: hypothetical protein AB7S26_29360 [Sandaracinaceae bacterium]